MQLKNCLIGLSVVIATLWTINLAMGPIDAVNRLRRDQLPIPNGYNATFSKTVLAYGVLSYCPKKCIEKWDCDFSKNYPKLINVTHINNDVTLAAVYIGYEPISKNVYISWRGSANAQNWIEDFTIAMEPFEGCKGCYIHVGFHEDYHLN